MSRRWIALRSTFYAALFLTLWTWAALMCRVPDKYHFPRVPGWLRAPGVGMVLAGAALCLVTVGYFIFEGYGTPAIFDPPIKFVPHGPFRFVRNPMYCGYVLVLLGLGLCFSSVSMLLFAVVAFLLIHTFVIYAEEPGLRKRFGQEYQAYCKSVPRWVPRFNPPRLPP